MAKRKNQTLNKVRKQPVNKDKKRSMAFSFGEPESVLSNNLADYLGVFLQENGEYYEPPVSLSGLGKLLRANAHHGAILPFKRNLLVKNFVPSLGLSRQTLLRAGLDYLVFGMAYFQNITNAFGQTLYLKHIPTINMRRMQDRNRFLRLRPGGGESIKFAAGEIIQVSEYDVNQQLYGVPDYLGGMQALMLNEAATLFRRRYYENGAHMGYIFYTTDESLDPDDEELLKTAITNSKGVGNFRSMFMNVPGGDPDGVKIIPVGDIATKDEFERVKNISRNDILSMHRIQPALAGIMPEQNSGFGDLEKIARVYFEFEVEPLQQIFLQLNDHLPGPRQFSFKETTNLTLVCLQSGSGQHRDAVFDRCRLSRCTRYDHRNLSLHRPENHHHCYALPRRHALRY